MQIFIKDDITKETYKSIANFSKLEKVTDKPSANNYFVYDTNGLSFVKDSENPKEVLHVDFLKGTLGWRLKRVNHERNLRKALGKTNKQLSIFDSTAGLLTDTMIFLSLGHKVVAVEQSKIIYSLVKDAIFRAKEKIPELKNLIFLNDNSLLNQLWIIDPKKKVSDVLKENSQDKPLKILDFIRYKVGEGV